MAWYTYCPDMSKDTMFSAWYTYCQDMSSDTLCFGFKNRFFLNVCCVLVFRCFGLFGVFVLYWLFCHGAPKLYMSTLFTTFFP